MYSKCCSQWEIRQDMRCQDAVCMSGLSNSLPDQIPDWGSPGIQGYKLVPGCVDRSLLLEAVVVNCSVFRYPVSFSSSFFSATA